ncbi:MAG: HAMP domain-containing histidine kinase [Verrucomicrobiae bacterium]|jgi:signal transduction histidine kinase|nr:HAMP domain-containing histidine kinase [Verrucomicrobiae bacterium]
MNSPILKVLELLFYAPEPTREHTANRIRFMERDVFLTIKVASLLLLSYFLYSSEPFEDSNMIRGFEMETVRGAFLFYCIVSLCSAVSYLFMARIPHSVLQWVVFVVNLTDGIFVAILVGITGGLQSAIYWVFLVLVIRNAVSVPMHRRQLLLNLLVILCYVFATIIDRTRTEMEIAQEDFETKLEERMEGNAPAEPVVYEDELGNLYTNAPASGAKVLNTDTDVNITYALGSAMMRLGTSHEWQPLLAQNALLFLLALCCHGISTLWTQQELSREEEQEFAARQNQLRSTGRLAAEIAHQLKNPLAIINNAAFSLTRALKEADPGVHAKLEMIKEEIERSDRILTELMGYAKLTEGKVEKLEIADELASAVAQVFPPAIDHKVRVNIDCPPMFSPLLMQRGHLNEILVNLLTNARDVLQGNGTINIEVSSTDRDRVQITLRDNGPGLRPNQLNRVFEPYYSTKEHGTGLGLAIVKHNVEIYGGSVNIDSTLGKGTSFTLVFPYKVIVPVNV